MAASIRTESLVANQAAFSLQHTTSAGGTQTDNLKSGFVQLHQHLPLIGVTLVGPGIFRGQVLKEDASKAHFFVIYKKYTQREYSLIRGGFQ